jgi:hypothetical protein
LKTEAQNKINSLAITTNKQHDTPKFGIFGKPTTRDAIIHNNSFHPNEHERSAINYLINRMNAYQLTPDNKEQEKAIINEILINNGYQQQIMHQKHKHNPTNTTQNKMGNFHLS